MPRIARDTLPTRITATTIKNKGKIGRFLFPCRTIEYGKRSSDSRKIINCRKLLFHVRREGELFRSVLAETCSFLSFSDAVRMRRYENQSILGSRKLSLVLILLRFFSSRYRSIFQLEEHARTSMRVYTEKLYSVQLDRKAKGAL